MFSLETTALAIFHTSLVHKAVALISNLVCAGMLVVVVKSCLLDLGLLTRLRFPATESDLTSQSTQGESE